MSAIQDILNRLNSESRLRKIPEPISQAHIDLSSNDYLGLGMRFQEFQAEFRDRFPDAAFSSSASRLLSTRQNYHLLLEDFLASLYGKETLLFNSGYHANVGCIGALTLPSTLFLCDKLIHASIIDGLKINGAEYKRFPHNDVAKLKTILEKESGKYERIVIVVESIYSMDGDHAPLREIVEIRNQRHDVLLYVDEAHAFGVRGRCGLGLCEELGLIGYTDILIGTFGKAAASVGAFAVVSAEIKNLLINTARPFIFSTALPPVNVAWSLLMTEKIIGMEAERQHLQDLSNYFRTRLSDVCFECKETDPAIALQNSGNSQIIPFIIGDATKAVEIAHKLKQYSILALPIRRPTVPPGGERIRFSLSAALTEDQLGYSADMLEQAMTQYIK